MAGRQYLKRNPDLRRQAGSRAVSNAASPQTRRTLLKRSSTERRSQPLTEGRGRPAPASARPSEQARHTAKEEQLSGVLRQLEDVKKERSLLQRRLQAAEDYVSKNYPVGVAADSSAVPPRFNSGDPDNTGEYGTNHPAARSVGPNPSESRQEQGSSGADVVSQSRSENTTPYDTNTPDDSKGFEVKVKAMDSAIVLVRSKQVRRLIQYLQDAPSTVQKYNKVRQLIEGCNGPTPPSNEKLWERLACLTRKIRSKGSDSKHSRD